MELAVNLIGITIEIVLKAGFPAAAVLVGLFLLAVLHSYAWGIVSLCTGACYGFAESRAWIPASVVAVAGLVAFVVAV